MKKAKKVLALVLAFALTVAGTMGATIAWLHDDDAETNVFTIGNVEIDLIETPDANGDGKWDNQNAKLLPATGSAQDDTLQNGIAKEVSVKNTGTESAYVRVHIAIPTEMDDGNPNFDASRNFLHFNFDADSVVYGQWSWLPTYSTGTGYKGNGAGNWNFYETDITEVEDDPATTDVDETVKKPYNVYVVTYRSVLRSGEITGTDVITNVYLDKSVNATATKVKDENGEDVVASYTYFDNKGNSFTLTAEEAHNIQIKIIAEGAQTATFENAYDALNTAFGVPGTYNPWN